jgi:hypothetical protein
MGTHGRRGMLDWFKSNVTDQVVRHAECSVLIERAAHPAVPDAEKPEPTVIPLPAPVA